MDMCSIHIFLYTRLMLSAAYCFQSLTFGQNLWIHFKNEEENVVWTMSSVWMEVMYNALVWIIILYFWVQCVMCSERFFSVKFDDNILRIVDAFVECAIHNTHLPNEFLFFKEIECTISSNSPVWRFIDAVIYWQMRLKLSTSFSLLHFLFQIFQDPYDPLIFWIQYIYIRK